MASSFKVSIYVCFGLITSFLLLVFIAVYYEVVSSMGTITQLSSRVREEKLPQLLETQRIFINIENLRRVAEIAYKTNDPKERRAARLDAQAMSMEAIYVHDMAYSEKVRVLTKQIHQMSAARDNAHEQGLKVLHAVNSYGIILQQMSSLFPDEALQRLEDAYGSHSLYSLLYDEKHFPGYRTTDTYPVIDAGKNALVRLLCESYAEDVTPLQSLCVQRKQLVLTYMRRREDLDQSLERARQQWEDIDEGLRELRDHMVSDAELVVATALASIEENAEHSRYTSMIALAGGALALLASLLALHRFLVHPLRWTGQKLLDIQQGNLHGHMPAIHVTELHDVASLLDRFSHHLSELYSHTSQLEVEAARKQDLETIMHAVFQVSLDGYCVWAPEDVALTSHGLLRLLHLDTEEIAVQSAEIHRMVFVSGIEKLYADTLSSGVHRVEREFLTRDGENIPCEITRVPVVLRGSKYVLSYFRDLRTQKRTELALRQARDEARNASEVKSNFLARMSHEIRTPMNGVLGLTHLALKHSPPPEQRYYLEKIQASARILLGVINDILDFSKIESGKLTLAHEPFSVANVLTTLDDLFSAQAGQRGLSFTIERDPAVPEHCIGDELRLSQVLVNLCGNAVKFTEQGGVTVRLALQAETPDSATVLFSVTDTGLGMSQEDLQELFQPFTQADTSSTRKYGGTGLGLVISQTFVRLMGGADIAVDSTPGQGRTFAFTVCLDKDTDAVRSPEESPVDCSGQLSGMRVLLTEDNEVNQEIAVALLESFGMQVFIANNGREALDILEQEAVDGVLMDIQMPVMDGLAATEHIRRHAREDIRTLPIIAMTAHALQDNREKTLAAGMNDHVTKPIDVNELVAKLCQWLVRS